MSDKRIEEVKAKVAQKKSAKVTPLSDVSKLVLDTSRLKNRKTSTEILRELRYQVK